PPAVARRRLLGDRPRSAAGGPDGHAPDYLRGTRCGAGAPPAVGLNGTRAAVVLFSDRCPGTRTRAVPGQARPLRIVVRASSESVCAHQHASLDGAGVRTQTPPGTARRRTSAL